MKGFYIKPLNDRQKGIIALIGGVLILFYALNFFEKWLNIIVIFSALGLIVWGVIKSGLGEELKKITRKIKKNKKQ